jgi:signal peptidase I
MKTESTFASLPSGNWLHRINLRKETRQGHILLCVALWSAISFLIFSRYVLATVIIDGASMEPSLTSGDTCLLNRLEPLLGSVDRGEVVVLQDRGPTDYAIKRVIGLPNDVVEIRDGHVFVNGSELIEEYLAKGTSTVSPNKNQGRIVVGPESYFVLGDNREISEDSRYYGPIKKSALLGVVFK